MSSSSSNLADRIAALAPKYQRAGPRYTSYPTAPHMREDFPTEAFESICATQSGDTLNQPLSLYVHIPFCESICYYCACNKVVTRKPNAGYRYLSTLSKELDRYQAWNLNQREVTQLHWGGGTPTYLSAHELTQLMHLLARHYSLSNAPDREYSIEIDPRTVDGQTIALLKGLGFNRLSLGIQDFDPVVQKAINRIQPFEQVAALTKEIREHNFVSLSFDLIYGLPHQSVASFDRTLEQVIELGPDRIACYNYAHLPQRFPSQRVIGRLSLPSAEQKLLLQQRIDAVLESSGYELIGLDHYVKKHDELAIARRNNTLQRNFQGYSLKKATDMISLGHSAISQVGDMIVQNARNLETYYARLESDQTSIERGLRLTKDDLIRRDIIMDICCRLEFSPHSVCEQYQEDAHEYLKKEMETLHQFVHDGLLQTHQQTFKLTHIGRYFLRNICMVFDAWLEHTPSGVNYSKTI